MNVLAVDTSSDCGSVTLRSGSTLLAEVRLANSLQHSERLFRSIDFIFEQVDMRLSDVNIFAAARGPGSFTGLRVGLAAMEGFAFASRKQSVGVSTLRAWAWRAPAGSLVSPVLDARRGEVYCALYRRDLQDLVELRAPAVLKPAQWLAGLPQRPIVFCGTGVEALGAGLDKPIWRTAEGSRYLAGAIAEIALTESRERMEPLYIRRSDAEVNRPAGQGG